MLRPSTTGQDKASDGWSTCGLVEIRLLGQICRACVICGGLGVGLVRLLLFTKEVIHPTKNAVCFFLFYTERGWIFLLRWLKCCCELEIGTLMFYCCLTSFWENDRIISWVTREEGENQTNKAPAILISPQEDNNRAQGGNDSAGIY